MRDHFRICLVFYFMIKTVICEDLSDLEEYCISEIFRPKCHQQEVIVIEQAIFGRRVLGRCLKNERKEMTDLNFGDQKAVGCYSDIRNIVDPLCSLKQSCEVRVAELTAEVPCYSFLRYFLEVQYSCIRVVQENRQCTVDLAVDKQHISTSQFSKSGCGSRNQPWIANSLAGQNINISIIQFQSRHLPNASSDYFFSFDPSGKHRNCQESYIQDQTNKKKAYLCFRKLTISERKTMLTTYTSDSSNVEIVLSEDLKNSGFLLTLEATGCSDLIPPVDAWLKRTENEAIIGCYSTRMRWQLKCMGQRWIGVIGNCSQGRDLLLKSGIVMEKTEKSQDRQMVTIFSIVTAGVVVCLLITCLGIVFLKRYYAMTKSRALKQMSTTYKTDNIPSAYHNGSIRQTTGRFLPGDCVKESHGNETLFEDDKCDIQNKNLARYYELDQSFVDKGPESNAV